MPPPDPLNPDCAANDFRPTATLETLRLRARLLNFTRAFFDGEGYWEVQTPLLSRDTNVDAHIEPFAVPAERGDEWFLQTSPEFAMKRLLAAGADAIWQIGPAFRLGEIGRLHNTEFTMIEWYRGGSTYHEQMDFTERFVRAFFRAAASFRGPAAGRSKWENGERFVRLTYDEAFAETLGTPVLGLPTADLISLARESGIVPPESLAADDRDGWLNLLLSERVEPSLGFERPVFLHDYPASQAALAVVRAGPPDVAERFELYVDGIELCNGYQELTDAAELRRRFRLQSSLREAEHRRALPIESRLAAAMDAGLPECSGVALGFDRLLMLALGLPSLAEVLCFDSGRA